MNALAQELHAQTGWSDRLAFDVALTMEGSGFDINEVLSVHQIDAAELARFGSDPVFARKVDNYRSEIREKGLTFKLKARAQAEELLNTSWTLIHDRTISPAVRADLIKMTVKWAGLEPRGDQADTPVGEGVKIVINMGPPAALPGDDAKTVVDAVAVDTPMVTIG